MPVATMQQKWHENLDSGEASRRQARPGPAGDRLAFTYPRPVGLPGRGTGEPRRG